MGRARRRRSGVVVYIFDCWILGPFCWWRWLSLLSAVAVDFVRVVEQDVFGLMCSERHC